jgi:hypothetical protein
MAWLCCPRMAAGLRLHSSTTLRPTRSSAEGMKRTRPLTTCTEERGAGSGAKGGYEDGAMERTRARNKANKGLMQAGDETTERIRGHTAEGCNTLTTTIGER